MAIFKRILFSLALTPFSLVAFATIWLCIAPAHLYHCWDDCPPFLISWYPPFIHPWANTPDGKLHDYYLAPGWVVYAVWFGCVAGALLTPALFSWWALRKSDGRAPLNPGLHWTRR